MAPTSGPLLALLLAAGCTASTPPPSRDTPTPIVAPAPERNSDGSARSFPPAPADLPGVAHVFRYEDFGPQALAGQLLGAEVYSFAAGCCFEPGDRFDVRVVVYADATAEATARARWPSGPTVGDHRFVAAATALAFVQEQLRELGEWPVEDRIPTLERTLVTTRERLLARFPGLPR